MSEIHAAFDPPVFTGCQPLAPGWRLAPRRYDEFRRALVLQFEQSFHRIQQPVMRAILCRMAERLQRRV